MDLARAQHRLASHGIVCRPAGEGHWSGVLLDTHDGSLAARGFAVAWDEEAGRAWLAGPQELVVCQSCQLAALPTAGPVGGRLIDALEGARLIPHVEARLVGNTFRIAARGRSPAYLGAWRCTFSSPAEPRRHRTVHLLAVAMGPGSFQWAQEIATALDGPRRARTRPLLAVGMHALGLVPPGAPLPAALHVTPEESLGGLAAKVLQRQAYQVRSNRFGTLHDLDPEYLHDLRVATRRARAALRLLRDVVPGAEELRAKLAGLGRLAGAARDLDVFAGRVAGRLAEAGVTGTARTVLTQTVEHQRLEARARLRPVLQGQELAALLARLDMACAGTSGGEEADELGSAAVLGPALVRRELARLRRWRHRLPGSLPASDLHAIRIAGKRARYALEFFAPVLGSDVRAAIRQFVELQDCLGAHQDAVVAQVRLAELARFPERTPVELLALGAALHLEREAQARERSRFAELAPELWQLTRELMQELRQGGTATQPEEPATS
jgi:CHAD domain-containing protein